MWPLTETRPKPLLPVAGKTVLERVLDACRPHVDGFVLVVGYRAGMIHDLVGDSYRGHEVEYVGQDEARGTGDAVAQAYDKVGGRFVVVNGDVLVSSASIGAVADADGNAVAVRRVGEPSQYGVVEVEDGYLQRIVEKPDDPSTDRVNAGVYAFKREVFEVVDSLEQSERGEIEITDALTELKPRAVEYEGEWMDVGYPWDLLEAQEMLLDKLEGSVDGEVADGAVLEGEVVVEEGATVRTGSVIEGPALIRSGATVGPNAYVRGPTTVEEGAKVGHACEVKASVLMEDARVSHLSYVGDSVLGEDVNLGAGTDVANLRHDDEEVESTVKGRTVDTGRRKFGAVFGDGAKTGIDTSLDAGVKVDAGAKTAPNESVFADVSRD